MKRSRSAHRRLKKSQCAFQFRCVVPPQVYLLTLLFLQVTPLLPLLHPCETQIINGLLELATEYDKLQRFMARHRDHERHRGTSGQGRRVLEMKVRMRTYSTMTPCYSPGWIQLAKAYCLRSLCTHQEVLRRITTWSASMWKHSVTDLMPFSSPTGGLLLT